MIPDSQKNQAWIAASETAIKVDTGLSIGFKVMANLSQSHAAIRRSQGIIRKHGCHPANATVY
jgi:hypothetical protein